MSPSITARLRLRAHEALDSPRVRERARRSKAVAAARETFVAGEDVDSAVEQARRLRRTHRMAALHPLLEPVVDLAGVERTVTEATTAIERVAPVIAGGGDGLRAPGPLADARRVQRLVGAQAQAGGDRRAHEVSSGVCSR